MEVVLGTKFFSCGFIFVTLASSCLPQQGKTQKVNVVLASSSNQNSAAHLRFIPPRKAPGPPCYFSFAKPPNPKKMADQACCRSGEEENGESKSIRVCGMQFAYELQPPLFVDFNLDIAPGSRCLLVGANGSGKTTLLKILAGKHMVGGRDVVRVLNRSAFHDTQLVCSGGLAYLGGSWSKTIGSAGEVPLQGDFSAEHMIFGVEGIDPVRREKLIELLDIDLQWRMHKVSDGQRRRVQICMGLLHPFQVLLLDEVTVDLDVVARMDLLDFFKEECEQRGATIVYATHIFDGLETWATHLAYIQDGELKRSEKLTEVEQLKSSENLLSVVEAWFRSETKCGKKKPINTPTRLPKSRKPRPLVLLLSCHQGTWHTTVDLS